MAATTFEVDANTASLLITLQTAFGVETNAAVIRKALALANIAIQQAGPDATVTIASCDPGTGKQPVKVSLAG